MREIKFRAWDKINSTMYENVHLLDSFNEKLSRPNEYELMQFTGLHDKNGKEIYEGDVVKSQDCLYEDVGTYQIKWIDDECGFWLFDDMLHFSLSAGEVASLHLEVIGNIYENPELLEV